jgi:hypothetical protein
MNSFENLDRKTIWIDYEEFFNKYYLTKNNSQLTFINKNLKLFKFLLDRHPFLRIYSVYYDKFVNNHLDDTLFDWKQLEEDILVQMKTNETLLTIRRYDLRLDFRTFILYIIDSVRKKELLTVIGNRLFNGVEFVFINYDWIGRIENFNQDGKVLLRKEINIQTKFIYNFLQKHWTEKIKIKFYQMIFN